MLSLFPAPHETIQGVSQALRTGELTCTQVVERCVANIDEWEPKVHAWVMLDREGALAQAKKLDESRAFATSPSPLLGIPIGIKDIIDVAGWPTAAGFEPWKERIAAKDAPIVAKLRKAGTIILGKTVTTQFASFDPPVTRNPWNLERTPGGSSSGSAAAVACGMCLGALGTQTGGSITRPASYCGVAGCKPRGNAVNLDGIVPLAPSMDHPGPIARTVGDLACLLDIIAGIDIPWRPVSEEPLSQPPRLGRLRGFFEEKADGQVRYAMEHAAETLRNAGAQIDELAWPAGFDDILHHHRVIMSAEAAAFHQSILDRHASNYAPRIRSLVEEGLTRKAIEYVKSREQKYALQRNSLAPWLRRESPRLDAVILPATTSTAPSRETTGDPAFNSPWSFLGFPTISFPIAVAEDGLPLAIQLVGFNVETRLFPTALWCERVIREASSANTNS
jgi:Asp-tRNA(Asn)/Glu-tRNA(Gln) amidotransferase A subunit family amidase